MYFDYKYCCVNEVFFEFDVFCFCGDGGDFEVNSEWDIELFIIWSG